MARLWLLFWVGPYPAAHDGDKDAAAHVGIHALRARQLQQLGRRTLDRGR